MLYVALKYDQFQFRKPASHTSASMHKGNNLMPRVRPMVMKLRTRFQLVVERDCIFILAFQSFKDKAMIHGLS